jgi:hypothetical protein
MPAFNRRILKSPYGILVLLVAYAAWQSNWWLLFGVPLIYLGWVCAAPNLNLADGCLPQLVVIVGLILGAMVSPRVFSALGAVCWVSWLVCSLELAWRCETGRAGMS